MREPARPTVASDGERRELVRARLRDAADASGFVPFDRFMEIALYGKEVGFYTRPDSPFGREGDYYTAAHASPLFGRAVAERVRSALATIPSGVSACIVELGPGDGTLGAGVIEGLSTGPSRARRVEYRLVERSSTLAHRALARVSTAGEVAGIPVRISEGVGADGPFHGVVLANEVLDAQPARRLRWGNGRWWETGIRLTDGGLVRAELPCDRPVPAPVLPSDLPDGTVLEVSSMAEALQREVADHLLSGLFLILDYGMDERELATAHPSGTLAGVRRHRFVDDPFADPGSSDLSVFVNTHRIRSAARAAGLQELAFRSQAEALGEWGLPRLLEDAVRSAPSAETEVRLRLGAKSLMFGFERFFALELAPAGPAGPALT